LGGAPVTRATLKDGDLLECGHTFFLFRSALSAPPDQPPDADTHSMPEDAALTSLLPAMMDQYAALGRIARSNVPVMLGGESGSGKEIVARAIHAQSGRSGPLVAVNCGALPAGLVVSQLFGHVRGAFSGAVRDEQGFFRAAHTGTLFLDEIADLRKAAQAALLRIL